MSKNRYEKTTSKNVLNLMPKYHVLLAKILIFLTKFYRIKTTI